MKKSTSLKNNMSIDDLAIMVSGGFKSVQDQLRRFDGTLMQLEEGQEQIKLKLDNVAYRFELVELQKRVELLEKRVGSRI